MGVSCISTIPKEKESVNTESTTKYDQDEGEINQDNERMDANDRMEKHLSITDTSEPFQINPNNIIKTHDHYGYDYKNINSLNGIDEYSAISAIASNELQGGGSMLTHEALIKHDMNCAMGIDSLSLSSVSTDFDDDTLKQVGHQLLSMNIKHTSISDDNKIFDDNKANNKYKQYKPRKCIHSSNKSTTKRKSEYISHLPQISSITSKTLSQTPIPNDFKMDHDIKSDQKHNDNKRQQPQYRRIDSDSNHHHHHHDHDHYHNMNIKRNKKRVNFKKNTFNENTEANECLKIFDENNYRESEEDQETDGTQEDDINFPDIYKFDRKEKRQSGSSRYEMNQI